MSADKNSANSDGQPGGQVEREQSGTEAGGIRLSAQSRVGEPISITVSQKRTSTDGTSAKDSVANQNNLLRYESTLESSKGMEVSFSATTQSSKLISSSIRNRFGILLTNRLTRSGVSRSV